jgi:hypothetical protein
MTRVKENLAAQERMNKENNVSPERLEMLKNLFNNPVISITIHYGNSSVEKVLEKHKNNADFVG